MKKLLWLLFLVPTVVVAQPTPGGGGPYPQSLASLTNVITNTVPTNSFVRTNDTRGFTNSGRALFSGGVSNSTTYVQAGTGTFPGTNNFNLVTGATNQSGVRSNMFTWGDFADNPPATGTNFANVNVTNTITAHNFQSSGSAPTIVTNLPGSTTSGTMDAATDMKGIIHLTTSSSAQVANAKYLTITFNQVKPDTNYFVGLVGMSAVTIVSGTPRLHVTNYTTGGFEIWTGNTAIGLSTLYDFGWFCAQ